MASTKLKLKTSQKLKDGSHPIIIQVLKDTKKAIVTVGISCFLKDWNPALNLPKNRRLSIICQKKLLEMEELLYEGVDKGWDAKKIVKVFSGKDTKELLFFKYQSELEFDTKNGVGTGLSDQTKLKKFKEFLGKDEIPFSAITFELLKDYKKYLQDSGYKSANYYLYSIRQVYNHAVENDDFIPKKNPFKSSLFSRKYSSGTTNRNLNIDQVQNLFQLDVKKSNKPFNKEQALDFWKFCFLMRGINVIEMAVMKPKDIKGDYFEFTREKLKTKITRKQRIRIYPEARVIIDKYLKAGNDYVFPFLDNGFNKDQNVRHYTTYINRVTILNYHLIGIGKELETGFNMTTMSARYTFVNLAKLYEVPFLYLQELIGHKTKSTTDVYLDIFPQSKIDQYHRMIIDLVLNPEQEKVAV